MKWFWHGEIGIGKSTFLRRMLQAHGWNCPRGYATSWDENRRGADVIWLESWDHSVRRPFAKKKEPPASAEVPYALNEKGALSAIQAACFSDEKIPLAIDELGIIELQSSAAVDLIQRAVASSENVMAIVQNRALDHWKSVFHAVEISWLPLTLANRDHDPNFFLKSGVHS